MPFKKKIVKVKKAPVVDELAIAKAKLALFENRKTNADDSSRFAEYDFWIAHYTKIIADLEK